MSETNQHYTVVTTNAPYIPTDEARKNVGPSEINIFDDPYLQQLWLNLINEYKHVFKKISLTPKVRFIIPIYNAHKMVENEQENLFKMITELETNNDFLFNFFTKYFQKFEFKNIQLNHLLKNAVNIDRLGFGLRQQINYVNRQISPLNLFDTLLKIQEKSFVTELIPFQPPKDLIEKNKLFIRLQHTTTFERLTYKAYQILQKLIFEDFQLIEYFTLNQVEREKEQCKSFEEKPEYTLLCQKYGKADINYIIQQYLTT